MDVPPHEANSSKPFRVVINGKEYSFASEEEMEACLANEEPKARARLREMKQAGVGGPISGFTPAVSMGTGMPSASAGTGAFAQGGREPLPRPSSPAGSFGAGAASAGTRITWPSQGPSSVTTSDALLAMRKKFDESGQLGFGEAAGILLSFGITQPDAIDAVLERFGREPGIRVDAPFFGLLGKKRFVVAKR